MSTDVVEPTQGERLATGGLRESKKYATRRALAERALQLALARGFQGFTIADLVADVGVSRRTFSNYFSSKADCISAVAEGWLDDVLDAIRDAPADASLLDVLQTGLIAVAYQGAERWGALQSVAATEPDVAACLLAGDADIVDVVSEQVAIRADLGLDDIRVRLLAEFAVTAGREVLTRWACRGAELDNAELDNAELDNTELDNAELGRLLEAAFSILNPAGLETPPHQ